MIRLSCLLALALVLLHNAGAQFTWGGSYQVTDAGCAPTCFSPNPYTGKCIRVNSDFFLGFYWAQRSVLCSQGPAAAQQAFLQSVIEASWPMLQIRLGDCGLRDGICCTGIRRFVSGVLCASCVCRAFRLQTLLAPGPCRTVCSFYCYTSCPVGYCNTDYHNQCRYPNPGARRFVFRPALILCLHSHGGVLVPSRILSTNCRRRMGRIVLRW